MARKKQPTVVALAGLGCAQTAALPPLSNTLFTLHPPLLVISIVASVLCLYHRQSLLWGGLALLGLAMVGGGFWSSQELNWGGWWNWDVLEMGSLFVWVIVAVGAHTGTGFAVARGFAGLAATTALTFYLLNKTGLGVSIHSFVTSDVVRTNYVACTTLTLVVLSSQVTVNTYAAIICCLVYSGASSFEALKLPATAVVFLQTPLRGWQYCLHAAARTAACIVVVFNYYNTLFTGPCSRHTDVQLVSGGPRVSVSSGGYKLVHLVGWRAKPLPINGSCLGSTSLRSSSGPARWVAYAK